MSTPSLTLDAARLLGQIRTLGTIGVDPSGGLTRLTLTDADKAGRDQVAQWMHELDLEVRVDRIGNLFGMLQAASKEGDARPLMIGSHIDSMRNAGMLDGPYGVLSGLAVARAYRDAGVAPRRPPSWRFSPTKKGCVISRT